MFDHVIGHESSGRRFLVLRFLLLLFIVAAFGGAVVFAQQAGSDWSQYGWDLASSGASTRVSPALNQFSYPFNQQILFGVSLCLSL